MGWWKTGFSISQLCASVFLVNLVAAFSNDSLLWGPYRPNLYFGIRARIPQSLTTGLLWSRAEEYASIQQTFRYTCETSDNMAGYGWEEYDARIGGRQTIHDTGNKIDITTEFIKIPGGQHGGNWGARITGKPIADAPDTITTLVFAANTEGSGQMQLEQEQDSRGYLGTITFKGQAQELGDFTLEITEGPKSNRHPFINHPSADDKPLERTFVQSFTVPSEVQWQSMAILFQALKGEVDAYVEKYGEENPVPPPQIFTIPNNDAPEPNSHLVQKVFQGAFQFDVIYSSASSPTPMTSEILDREIKAATTNFSKRYKEIFAATAPFDKPKYDVFSKALFSNLLGGVGYFFGDSVVDDSSAPEYDEEEEGFWMAIAEARKQSQPQFKGPYELFSSVPSRPFFPRGFLWDEGFHLLPIVDWDIELTLGVLASWLKLMDEDGWIAREQILGPEARSKVPPEFTTQVPQIANPPTLFLVFDSLMDKLNLESSGKSNTKLPTEQHEGIITVLRDMYPYLKRHYHWYRRTQKGDIKSYDRDAFSTREAWRWRGRTPSHILASGLDDYPRAQPPHPGELHVDLMSWMGMMARSMRRIASLVGEKSEADEFEGYETATIFNLDDLHWSKKEKAYCDASIDEYEEHSLVCHKGYMSLFPFMTGLVAPDSPKLGSILDLISDKDELWSPYGIRSLSKKDEFYETGENYWRSPIWMNMNYLVLTNLLRIAQASGPHKERARTMYTELRSNLIETVYQSWRDTGFAWEQYNPDTGKGQRTAHFTGWTSLVVKMMCMPVLEKQAEVEHGEL